MWYVKNEFQDKIFFKSQDVRKTQNYVDWFNHNYKFSGQRMFRFNLYDFCGFTFYFQKQCVDVALYTQHYIAFTGYQYSHPFAVKHFNKRHMRYLDRKLDLLKKLCKKYHVWSFNEHGRKADGFDF